jgi:site-specific DNA recombinase
VVAEAAWPAIIDRDTYERLTEHLAPKGSAPPRTVKRLLTRLAYCGRCGARLYSKPEASGTATYRCVREPGRGQGTSCGRLSVVADRLDEAVADQVLAALAGAGLATALAAAAGGDADRRALSDQLVADEARLEELAADYADGALTRAEWKVARERLAVRIGAARQRLSRGQSAAVLASLPATEAALRQRWEAAAEDVTWRRGVVQAVVERVEVAPKGSGGHRFDPDRVTIRWRA